MADITFDEMKALFEQFFGPGAAASEALKALKEQEDLVEALKKQTKEINQNIKALKKAQAESTSFENILKGNTVKVEVNTDAFNKLNEAISNARKITDDATRKDELAALRKQKRALIDAQLSNAFGASLHNLKISTLNVADSLIKGAFDFAKGLQSGQGGVELATNTALKGVETTKKLVDDVGNVAGTLAGVLGAMAAAFPIGKIAKGIGAIASVVGIGSIVASKGLDYTAKATEYLGEELKKTEAAFKVFTETGAQFAGGMTELRAQAANAGLDVTQFAAVVKSSRDDLVSMGLGIGEASKRIGNVSKILRDPTQNLGIQLRKLGYSTEEQAELGAQVAANLAFAGKLRVTSDKEVADMTLRYGKDLKVLQAITGEDVKKKNEESRRRSLEVDVYEQVLAKGGKDAVLRLREILTAMPLEEMKADLLQKISVGGADVFTRASTNIIAAAAPEYKRSLQSLYDAIFDPTKKMGDAGRETTKTMELLGKSFLEGGKRFETFGQVVRLGAADANIKETVDRINKIRELGITMQVGATENAVTATNAAAENIEKLDENIAILNDTTQAFRAALGKETTQYITGFADKLRSGIETVDSALKKIGVKGESRGESMGSTMGGLVGAIAGMKAGAAVGAAAGAPFAGVGAAPGAVIGGALGGVAGGLGLGALGSWAGAGVGRDIERWSTQAGPEKRSEIQAPTGLESNMYIPGAAKGGILSGATTGFNAILHGVEAVVPLPDGKTIPVTIDTNALSAKTVNPINNMSTQIQQLSTALMTFINKPTDVTEPQPINLTELKNVINDLNNTARAQLEKHEQMVRHLQDQKDITERMLNNTY